MRYFRIETFPKTSSLKEASSVVTTALIVPRRRRVVVATIAAIDAAFRAVSGVLGLRIEWGADDASVALGPDA